MTGSFVFDTFVTGKNFVGRSADCTTLSNLLLQGENVVIYEPPKTGKTSLVKQTLYSMKLSLNSFIPVELSLLNVRSLSDLVIRMGSEIIKSFAVTPAEYADAVRTFLPGTHLVFDQEAFSVRGTVVSLNWDADLDDLKAVLKMPYLVSERRGGRMYVIMDEFQNVMSTGVGDEICGVMQSMFKSLDERDRSRASYVLMGSCVNAMKDIFAGRKLFYRTVSRLELSEIDTKDLIDHIVRGFMSTGKVIDRDLMLSVCGLFRNNAWYINHFAFLCDSLSKGYIMEPVLLDALRMMTSIHAPQYEAVMNDLTTFQICLLRAVLDGQVKFSSTEVIRRYNLNSSANVRRLKDALCKKEIITFEGENETPLVLDPLFEHWVRKYFFGIEPEGKSIY